MSNTRLLRHALLIGIFLLPVLAATPQSLKSRISLLWRKALHHPILLRSPYQAPLAHCDLSDVIPDSYCVFLHQDYSLESHLETVGKGTDLASKITNTFPRTNAHGLYYCADDMSLSELNAVRADIAVDLIDCQGQPEVDLAWEVVEEYPDGNWHKSATPGAPNGEL